jgi:AcrR family transcriptional regulator
MTAPPKMRSTTGKREQAREERRQRVLAAARWLLVEGAEHGFSMPRLAQKAGLSLATPYNLFGGKAEILAALFEADVGRFHINLQMEQGDATVSSIARALEQLSEGVTRHQTFYFNLWKNLTALGIDPSRKLVLPLSRSVLAPIAGSLVDPGSEDGVLRREVLTDHFSRLLEINFIHWISAGWSAARLNSELSLGLFSLASVHADPHYRTACVDRASLALEQIAIAKKSL